jgi:Domain of unknown function (DUF4142)
MLQYLEKPSGRDFDLAYIRGQVTEHQMAAQLFEWEIGSGQDSQLRAFAAQVVGDPGRAGSVLSRAGRLRYEQARTKTNYGALSRATEKTSHQPRANRDQFFKRKETGEAAHC